MSLLKGPCPISINGPFAGIQSASGFSRIAAGFFHHFQVRGDLRTLLAYFFHSNAARKAQDEIIIG